MKSFLFFFLTLCATPLIGQGVLHQVRVSSGDEDGDERDGIVQIYDLELDMGWNNGLKSKTGIFFRDVFLSPNASVTSAVLSLTTQETFDDTITLKISVQNTPFPSVLMDTLSIMENRTFTDDSVLWTVLPGQKESKRQSPNLTALIQPVLSLPTWEASSSLFMLIETADPEPDSGSLKYQCYSYDQLDSLKRPTLRLFVDSSDINGVENTSTSHAQIYPNPSSGLVHVTPEAGSSLNHYSLYDLKGRILLSKKWVGNKRQSFNIQHLENAVYVLRNEITGKTQRLIKH